MHITRLLDKQLGQIIANSPRVEKMAIFLKGKGFRDHLKLPQYMTSDLLISGLKYYVQKSVEISHAWVR